MHHSRGVDGGTAALRRTKLDFARRGDGVLIQAVAQSPYHAQRRERRPRLRTGLRAAPRLRSGAVALPRCTPDAAWTGFRRPRNRRVGCSGSERAAAAAILASPKFPVVILPGALRLARLPPRQRLRWRRPPGAPAAAENPADSPRAGGSSGTRQEDRRGLNQECAGTADREGPRWTAAAQAEASDREHGTSRWHRAKRTKGLNAACAIDCKRRTHGMARRSE